jgi:hypothetical protein
MLTSKLKLGKVYLIRHAAQNDPDFGRYPCYEGPGLALELTSVFGSHGGGKEERRQRGGIRYMDKDGREWCVGVKTVRELIDDPKLEEFMLTKAKNKGLRFTEEEHALRTKETAEVLNTLPVDTDVQRILSKLKREDLAVEARITQLEHELTALRTVHAKNTSVIAALELALDEGDNGIPGPASS